MGAASALFCARGVHGAGRVEPHLRAFKPRPGEISMYQSIPHDLLEVIEPIVLDHGLEVVDAAPPVGGKSRRLQVIVDTPEGDGRVTLDECATVSREIGHALDATDLMPGSYVLEVSSPGIDRVLGRAKDFERAVGRRAPGNRSGRLERMGVSRTCSRRPAGHRAGHPIDPAARG